MYWNLRLCQDDMIFLKCLRYISYTKINILLESGIEKLLINIENRFVFNRGKKEYWIGYSENNQENYGKLPKHFSDSTRIIEVKWLKKIDQRI